MKLRKITMILISLVMAFSFSFALCACGGSNDDEGEEYEDLELEAIEEETSSISEEEAKALASKASELNKDETSFFGTWKATSSNAQNLYGNLEIEIKKDGSVIMDVADEHLEGTWEKVDEGIHFENELFEGDFYYGDRCQMIIKEIEEDDEIQVVLTKVK